MHFALASASTVVIAGRSPEPLEEAKSSIEAAAPGCKVVSIVTNVVDEMAVQQLFDGVPDIPDVLVNCAGTASSKSSIMDSEPSVWWSDYVGRYNLFEMTSA